ncbi:MAG: AGE family epimerase/isomerase [Rhizomicrobium sp.]|jgi:mannobiose 2-epimerase
MSQTVSGVWTDQFRKELVGNILPFWMRHAIDREHGGFYGTIDCDLHIETEAPRASVIGTRLLWTFAAATRLLGDKYQETAEHCFDYVANAFWDRKYGGLFWTLDHRGNPLSTRKQIYAQAFGIYALAEYFRATGNTESIDLAKRLFWLIEDHGYDPDFKGYWEARDREWHELDDMRLSDKDLNSPKSMNTHLHVMEAYTNLLRVWRDPSLAARQSELLKLTLDRIVDPSSGHFKLFFDERWNSLSGHVSFGHDIEGSWLMVETAKVLGDPELIARTRKTALTMVEAVYTQGLDRDGSLFYEANGQGELIDSKKHWWAQAEAVVGFYNAYEISGEARFLAAAHKTWDYIETKVVDHVHGEWHAKLTAQGVPLTAKQDPDACLVGPWKCPYHNARACFEMIDRLGKQTNGKHTQ